MLSTLFIYTLLILTVNCSSFVLNESELYGYITLGIKGKTSGSSNNSYSFVVYKATISPKDTHPQIAFISSFSLLLFRINKGIIQTTYNKFEEQDFSMDILSDLTGTKYDYVGGPVKYTPGNVEASKINVYQDLNFELLLTEYSDRLSAEYTAAYFPVHIKRPQYFCILSPFLKKNSNMYTVQNESNTDKSPYGDCIKFKLQIVPGKTGGKTLSFLANGIELTKPNKLEKYSKTIHERNFFRLQGYTYNLAKYSNYAHIRTALASGDDLLFVQKIDDLFNNSHRKIHTPKRSLRMHSYDFWEYINISYKEITSEKMESIVKDYKNDASFVQYAVTVPGAPKEKMYVVGVSMCSVIPNEETKTELSSEVEVETDESSTDKETVTSERTTEKTTNSTTESKTEQQKSKEKLSALNIGLIAAVIGIPILMAGVFYLVIKKKLNNKNKRLRVV